MRVAIVVVVGLLVGACAPTLVSCEPTMVGVKDGVPMYTIGGNTSVDGDPVVSARTYANEYATEMCPNGNMKIQHVEVWDTKVLSGQRAWAALFTCEQLAKRDPW